MSGEFQVDNFETIGLLGRGGMAAVWKARQISLDRLVAIKVLASGINADSEDVARFHEEARAAGRLKHPGIVQVYDANFSNGNYYFVMELVDGYTVGEWIRRKGRLDEADALTVAESVINALDYAWSSFGIIHCDIKPDNIMVDADGSVKVTDLGLARAIVSMQSNELEKEVLGTPAYMSPEQVIGQPDLDCRADIYALGATIYHMVTGHTLFAGEGAEDEIMQKQLTGSVPSPSREAPNLSRCFLLLLARMLAKDRAHRPQDWKEVMKNIRRVRTHNPPVGQPLLPGSSTIITEATKFETVRRPAITDTTNMLDASEGAKGVSFATRVVLWSLLAIGFIASWVVIGFFWQPRKSVVTTKAPYTVEEQYKTALAYVNANPDNWKSGIAHLEAVLKQAPDSWYAQPARVQLDRLCAQRELVLQDIYRKTDAQLREMVALNHIYEALRLLERYQGPYPAETLAWRQEKAQLLRSGHFSTPMPAAAPTSIPVRVAVPSVLATNAPTPVSTPRPATNAVVVTEEEGVQRVCRALLRKDLAFVTQMAVELDGTHVNWTKGDFASLLKMLKSARRTERELLDTFAVETGQHVSVVLRQETIKGVIGSVHGEHVFVTLPSGGTKKFTLDDLDFSERLQRLRRLNENTNGNGGLLLKAVWAYRAHAKERAKTLFAELPAPVGAALVRAVDETL